MQAPDFSKRGQPRDPDYPIEGADNPRVNGDVPQWSALSDAVPRDVQPPGWSEPHRARSRWWLHISLFLLTAAACWMVDGIAYAIGLMSILLAHEMGHYVMSRRWRVRASAPYFLPFPSVPGLLHSPIGTLGAVIVMKSRIPNRRALIDIGASGPIAGFLVALVVITIGYAYSVASPYAFPAPPAGYMAYVFGESLLTIGLKWFLFGPLAAGTDVISHPLVRAGKVGLFVTAFNLLPVGQLDGGHIVYALFPHRHRAVAIAATVPLLAFTVYSPVWTFFAVFALVFGRRHPPPVDNITPLDAKRRNIGYLCFAIFVLCFMPTPIDVIGL